MLELLIADSTRTSVSSVRVRDRTDWLMVAVWAVGLPVLAVAGWAAVGWATGLPVLSVACWAGLAWAIGAAVRLVR